MSFLEYQTSKTGKLFPVYHEQERVISFLSKYNPEKQVNNLLLTLDNNKRWVFLYGFPGFWVIEEILKYFINLEELIIIHPDNFFLNDNPEVQKEAILANEKVIFITGSLTEIKPFLASKIHANSLIFLLNDFATVNLGEIRNIAPHFFKEVTDFIKEQILALTYDIKTRMLAEIVQLKNIFANLKYYIDTPDVGVLQGKLKGFKGVIIGAGPSVKERLPLLAEQQDRLIIIAVDTVLKLILDYGIVPDFIVTADSTDNNYDHFAGVINQVKHIPLILTPVVSPLITSKWLGPMLFYQDTAELFNWGLAYFGKKTTTLIPAINVGFLGLSLASLLGLDKIFLTGFDFAFKEKEFYAAGLTQKKLELKEIKGVKKLFKFSQNGELTISTLIDKKNDLGQVLLTTDLMSSYLVFYEHLNSVPQNVFNLAESGFLLKDCQRLAVSLFINELKTTRKIINKEKIIKEFLQVKKCSKKRVFNAKQGLIKLQEKLADLIKICEKGLECIAEYKKTGNKISEIAINKYLEQQQAQLEINKVISKLLTKELFIIQKIKQELKSITDPQIKKEYQVKSIEILFTSVIQASQFFLSLISQAFPQV